MPANSLMRSMALIMLGFILGIIIAGYKQIMPQQPRATPPADSYTQTNLGGRQVRYVPLAKAGDWDIVTADSGQQVALGRDGRIHLTVIDDKTALYILAYGSDSPVWDGRLVDFGKDGRFEVADISAGHCENFGN